MRISDWSSDVCSSDLNPAIEIDTWLMGCRVLGRGVEHAMLSVIASQTARSGATRLIGRYRPPPRNAMARDLFDRLGFSRRATRENGEPDRSEEHTSALQSLMRTSSPVFCLTNKTGTEL